MAHGAAAYPPQPLHDYAMLGDGERGALIGPRGEIAWMCAPAWDDEPVFASLLGAGLFAVTPVGERFVSGGYYEEGSLIWRSRWITTSAVVECREALVRPADPDSAAILRRIEGSEGTASLQVVLDPRVAGGDEPASALHLVEGTWYGRLGDLFLRCTGMSTATVEGGALVAEVELCAGRQHDLLLEIGRRSFEARAHSIAQLWTRTEAVWRDDVPAVEGWWARRDVRQALAVVAGMTSAAGGMVAAATRSLPERAERGRDYDYRYAWIRDQAMVGQAMATVGPHRLMEAAVDFVSARLLSDGEKILPAYTVAGRPVPGQGPRKLLGYPGAIDRSGNDANNQFQLDVFGEALNLFTAAARHGDLAADTWRAVEQAVGSIERTWQCPDAGIWELDERRWTHSRLMLVCGLRRAAAIAPRGQGQDWEQLARRIADSVERECVHPSGRWQRAPDDDRVDAGLLIPLIRSHEDPTDDPRARRTADAILSDLTEEEFCYRFRHEKDGSLGDVEGAFVLSGFHMAMVLQRLGRPTLAARWFERNRASCGAPGLFCEEYDVVQRQQRGNLPQAFVHGALIECSALLSAQ